MKHCYYALCIKLIAHLCWYSEKYNACAMNIKTYKVIHGYFCFIGGIIRAFNCILMSFIAQWMLLDSSGRVFVFSQSWIMSGLLSSLSPSQSHIHYVRRMYLNSIQGKRIPSVVLKNFKSCALTILREKWSKLLPLVRSLLQYPVLIGQSPLFSSEIMISRELLHFMG